MADRLNFLERQQQKGQSDEPKPKKTPLPPAQMPWVEKYRPQTVNDVVYQDEVVSTLRKSIETGNLPHLLFYGPPGTGKTSTILAIAHQLYGPHMRSRVLELNASDERGIEVIRNKVKTFSSLTVAANQDYNCPPYKIIILDEADNMTGDAQNALRRTMETYSTVTRFCLICNYVSRIIEPLASRCAKFRFRPVESELLETKLMAIATLEHMAISQQVANLLAEVSGGDMRKAITYLQSLHHLYGAHVDVDAVYTVSGHVPDKDIKEAFEVCRSNSFARLQVYVNKVIQDGYSVAQFLEQFLDALAVHPDIASDQKARITERVAVSDAALVDGADEYLQLLAVCAETMKALCS